MRGRRRLGDAKLLRDEDHADAVLDQVAVSLGREVRLRVLQPVEDLQALRVRQRREDVEVRVSRDRFGV
jgi:hypothetical protein